MADKSTIQQDANALKSEFDAISTEISQSTSKHATRLTKFETGFSVNKLLAYVPENNDIDKQGMITKEQFYQLCYWRQKNFKQMAIIGLLIFVDFFLFLILLSLIKMH